MLCGAPRGGVAQAGDFLQLPLPARGAQPGLITAPPPPPRPAGRGVSAAGGGAGYNQSQAGNSSRGAGPGCRGWGRRGGGAARGLAGRPRHPSSSSEPAPRIMETGPPADPLAPLRIPASGGGRARELGGSVRPAAGGARSASELGAGASSQGA